MAAYLESVYKQCSVTVAVPVLTQRLASIDVTAEVRRAGLMYLYLANGLEGSLVSAVLLDFLLQHVQLGPPMSDYSRMHIRTAE